MNKLFLPIFLFLSFLICNKATAQYPPGVYEGSLEIKGKKLIVVVDEAVMGRGFTDLLQEAMTEEWKLTPFKILTALNFSKSAKTYEENPDNIFMSFDLVPDTYNRGTGDTREMVIGSKIKKSCRVVRLGSPFAYVSSQYFLKGPIKADLVKDLTIIQKVIQYQQTQVDYVLLKTILKKRTLYVNKESLYEAEDEVKEAYPNSIKVVSSSDYYKALLQKDPKAAFAYIVRTNDMTFLCIFTMDLKTPLLWSQRVRGKMYLHFKQIGEKLEVK